MRSSWSGLLVAVLLAPFAAQAQSFPPDFDESFASASIPEGLAGGAPVVVRLNDQTITLRDNRRATVRVHRVLTVLAPEGRHEGTISVSYDKFRTVRRFDARLRDSSGRVIRRLRRGDFGDYSAIAGYSLYEDARARVAELYHDDYPYTVEFEVEVAYSGSLHYPSWFPQSSTAPVELARLTIERPTAVPIRYQAQGLELEPQVSSLDDMVRYQWQLRHLPVRRPEPSGPGWSQQMGAVHIAPVTFEIEGTRGSMASWSTFAAWYHELTEGRQQLPADAEAQVRSIVAGVDDDREKVRLLYRFLQERSRYVSVQLGLGGWQPFDATYVHERRYGDCKALTNYMLALLAAAGIEAFPALIQSGRGRSDVDPAFPRNAFNHTVLFVPLEADTLWLETTSRTLPFGHIGAANEDRWALVARAGGGELVRTPRSVAEQNRQTRRGQVHLHPDGNATAELEKRYTGNRHHRVRGALAEASPRDRQRWMLDEIDLPNFQLRSADYGSVNAPGEELALLLELDLPRYATRAGPRLFLQPNLMERALTVPAPIARRTQPVVIPYAFLDEDEFTYHLPEGFRLEAAPEPVDIEAPFGRYHASTKLAADGGLLYRRRLELRQREIPAEAYDAYRDFLATVAQADRKQVVLVAE